jgi:SnoaL-like polyketide cyclase
MEAALMQTTGNGNPADTVRSAVAALNDGDIDDSLLQLHAAFEGLHLHEILLFGDERFVCARWRLRGRHVNDYLGYAPKGQSIDTETCRIGCTGRRCLPARGARGGARGPGSPGRRGSAGG